MKKNLLNKLWLRVGMIVAIMTTALAGTVCGQTYEELFTIHANEVVSGTNYKAHTATVDGRDFVITFGGNNSSVGTNKNNRNNCNLNSYSKYAVSPVTTSSTASAFACATPISDVAKISYTFNGGSNQTNTKVYLLYSSDNNTFSQISLTSGAQGATISSGSEYTFDSKTGYFALLFEATNTSGNWRIDQVNVKFYKSVGTQTVATPTISGDESFLTSTQVSIACTTTGATIQYSTNNGSSWTTYSAPFTLTETTTVQAKATKSGLTDSEVASKTFTKITPLSNIAALTGETEAGSYYVTFTDAVVTFVSGNYAYIQDASGAVAVYKSEHGLTAGDVLNGTATVAYQVRNGNPQITDLSGVTSASGTAPEPTEVAASDWNYTFNNVLSQYFKVTGATITQNNGKYYISLGDESVQLYKSGTAPSITDLSATYTIVGFPTLFNTTKELQIFADPVAETITREELTMAFVGGNLNITDTDDFEVPTLNVTDESDEAVTGLTITYASNNEDCATVDATTGAVTIISYGTATITATFEGDDNYLAASASYIIKYSNPNQGEYTWDLSIDETATATTTEMTWTSTYATMSIAKGSASTNTNSYYPGTSGQSYTSTRFYKNSELTITPVEGYEIASVEFVATTEGYATALTNSTWTNATAAANGTTVTVTPTDGSAAISAAIGGTCGFTAVTVYYEIAEIKDAVIPVENQTIDYGRTFTIDSSVIEGGDITVTSANDKVATVEGLVITAEAVGTTTITVTTTATAAYNAGSATFTLTVNAPEGKTTAKVSSGSPIFEEYFTDAAGEGPVEGMEWKGTIGNGPWAADNEGWTAVDDKLYAGQGCAKFGNSSVNGSGTTPAIAFDGESTYTLSFKAGAWNNEGTEFTLSCDDTDAEIGTTSFTLTSNEWNVYTTTIKADANSKLTFSANGRFFLDDVVVATNEVSPIVYTIPTSGLGTFCSEYPLDLSALPEGVKAYIVTSYTTTSVKLTQINTAVKGGVGLIIEGTGGTEVEFESVDCDVEPEGNLLEGTLAPTYVAANTVYGMKSGQFHPNNAGTIPANRAYLPAEDGNAIKVLNIEYDDPTGISNLNDNVNANEGAIYNLSGQMVNGKLPKGIYIVNGKKILK